MLMMGAMQVIADDQGRVSRLVVAVTAPYPGLYAGDDLTGARCKGKLHPSEVR
jgi:hypothetical protein